MAPLIRIPSPIQPAQRSPHRNLPKGTVHFAASVRKLINIKVLLYVFLGLAAIFSTVLLFWKFGSFLRQFTRGRVFQNGKSFKTRYIKTWYGWVPQDRYNARQRAWKRVLGKPWRWLSWTDSSDDYSWVWWDPSCSGMEKHLHGHGHRRWLYRYLWGGDNADMKTKVKSTTARMDDDRALVRARQPACSSRGDNVDRSQRLKSVNQSTIVAYETTDFMIPLNPLTYFTFPLQSRPRESSPLANYQRLCLDNSESFPCYHPSYIQKQHFPKASPHRVTALHARRSLKIQRHINSTQHINRRAKNLREWAVRMQMGSLQDMISHYSGLDGRPCSPLSDLFNRSSDLQSIFSQHSSGLVVIDTVENPLSGQTRPAGLQMTTFSVLKGNKKSRSLHRRQSFNVASKSKRRKVSSSFVRTTSPTLTCMNNLLDDEVRFIDGLDRSLEWLLGECQPGRRGFSLPTLPNNWINKQARIVYATPCCASAEFMRLHGYSQKTDGFSDERKSAVLLHRVADTPHIDSWRAHINKQRRKNAIQDVKTIEHWESSAEEPPDNVLDPSSWILRRPPQGFAMSTKQKNSYYDVGGGRWEKFADWQVIDQREPNIGTRALNEG
ncbi:hypothetical protein BGW36DRAFT_411975 [Talaromyces proteolyticus]|uniref:Uncharacterized protein n=1 Tax=Talaromyces proteolyticus TaxID=1131652 RepID=A0AAD4KFU0_9EURO|nr:uncharacterized protein BGW36DRAFT_411975 [Talaromyces proteolyticus]KAH8690143.1 hypothetical protein BGW36DRAFT_411975 [Talaromyces proteolyticus]